LAGSVALVLAALAVELALDARERALQAPNLGGHQPTVTATKVVGSGAHEGDELLSSTQRLPVTPRT
jgi:hypothetical protein